MELLWLMSLTVLIVIVRELHARKNPEQQAVDTTPNGMGLRYRSLVRIILLGFVTLNMYPIVWMIQTKGEMERSGSPKIPSSLTWLVPTIIAVVAEIWFFVVTPELTALSGASVAALVVFISTALVAVGMFIGWLRYYAAAATAITKGAQTKQFYFWMGVVCYFIGVEFVWAAIVQGEFNKIVEKEVV